MKIWNRALLQEAASFFFPFLFAFYFLYILIDYSSRIDHFQSVSFPAISLFYACTLSQKTEFLIPFAFLMTLLKILNGLHSHQGMTSMLTAGVSYKRLLSPLFAFAFFLTSLLYLNFVFFEPYAQKKLELIKQMRKYRKNDPAVHSFTLDDDSKLIFRKFNPIKKSLEELYWIRSADHFFYCKELFPYDSPPRALRCFEFRRRENDLLELTAAAEVQTFQEMHIDFDPLIRSTLSEKTLTLSDWFRILRGKKSVKNKNALITVMTYKLSMPLLPLLLLPALAPFCLRFSRVPKTFFIYLFSIAGLLSFYSCTDAFYILSENRILSPFVALWIPFIVYFFHPIKKFYEL